MKGKLSLVSWRARCSRDKCRALYGGHRYIVFVNKDVGGLNTFCQALQVKTCCDSYVLPVLWTDKRWGCAAARCHEEDSKEYSGIVVRSCWEWRRRGEKIYWSFSGEKRGNWWRIRGREIFRDLGGKWRNLLKIPFLWFDLGQLDLGNHYPARTHKENITSQPPNAFWKLSVAETLSGQGPIMCLASPAEPKKFSLFLFFALLISFLAHTTCYMI